MSVGTGAGRGRGWLNLDSKSEPPRPGLSYTPKQHQNDTMTEQFPKLVNCVRQLNLTDDGILHNQKIKYILEIWRKECNSKELVKLGFEDLYDVSLRDGELAHKLILMVTSRLLANQQIADENIKALFVKKLQTNFENAEQMQAENPERFRNYVYIIGEFYNKTCIVNGKGYKFLASPIISVLKMLLTKETPDLILFTKQLFSNGSALLSLEPDSFFELIMHIRTVLITNPCLNQEKKAWLMFALDLYNYSFDCVPPAIFKFYEEMIDIEYFQQPKINIIQPINESITQTQQQNSNTVKNVNNTERNHAQNELKKIEQDGSEYSSDYAPEHATYMKLKISGRPILGAGARKNQTKSTEDELWKDASENWNNDQKISGTAAWHVQETNHYYNEKRRNKGWEHDDR